MSHSSHYDALILRAIDVGEADRFCIFFTRERGRLAARACGARRPRSRIGSALLPMQRAIVSLKESSRSAGLVTAAVPVAGGIPPGNLPAFFRAECGMELLLTLLHDEHPLPDLFDATVAFLRHSSEGDHVVVVFAIRALHILGLLPDSNTTHAPPLSAQERLFVDAARHFPLYPVPTLADTENVRLLCVHMLSGQLSHPLRGELASAVFGMKERDVHQGRDSRERRPDSCLPAGRT